MFRRVLSEIQPGVRGRVVRVRGRGDFHRRLMGHGLYYGRHVEIQARPREGVRVLVDGQSLSLSCEEASRICLEFA